MTATFLELRTPWTPHERLASVRPAPDFRYAFTLGQPSQIQFSVSRGDPNPSEEFAHGMMVTVKRSDGLHPWAGFITRRTLRLSDPNAALVAQDHAGALFAKARTAKDWTETTLAVGDLVRQVFAEAEARAEPPLMTNLQGASGGPVVAFTPRAEPVLDFLNTVCRSADYEWQLISHLEDRRCRVDLHITQRIGRDYRDQVTLEQSAFEEATLTQDDEGFLSSVVAVGGTGTFSARPAAGVSVSGQASPGIAMQTAAGVEQQQSPALQGTRVVVEQQVTNSEALLNAARRVYAAPDYVREQLSLTAIESSIDMKLLSLGSYYRMRFTNLAFDLGIERVIRVIGYSLGLDNKVEIEAQVLPVKGGLKHGGTL